MGECAQDGSMRFSGIGNRSHSLTRDRLWRPPHGRFRRYAQYRFSRSNLAETVRHLSHGDGAFLRNGGMGGQVLEVGKIANAPPHLREEERRWCGSQDIFRIRSRIWRLWSPRETAITAQLPHGWYFRATGFLLKNRYPDLEIVMSEYTTYG